MLRWALIWPCAVSPPRVRWLHGGYRVGVRLVLPKKMTQDLEIWSWRYILVNNASESLNPVFVWWGMKLRFQIMMPPWMGNLAHFACWKIPVQYDPFLLEVTVVTDGKRTNLWRKRIPLENFRNASSKCNFLVIWWDFLGQARHGNLIRYMIYVYPHNFRWCSGLFRLSHPILRPKNDRSRFWWITCWMREVLHIQHWHLIHHVERTTPKSTPRKVNILNRKMEICFRWCSFSIGWFLGSKS